MTTRTAIQYPLRPFRARRKTGDRLTLDEWVNETVEGTEDPYSHLDRDVEDREYINSLLGRQVA